MPIYRNSTKGVIKTSTLIIEPTISYGLSKRTFLKVSKNSRINHEIFRQNQKNAYKIRLTPYK